MSDVDLSRPWKSYTIVSFDLETTGTNTDTDRIIEIGTCVFTNGEVTGRWQQLVDPELDLPDIVTQVTGIKPEELRGQPTLAQIADQVVANLSGDVLLAYNHEFDTRILTSEFARIGRTITLPVCLDPFPFCYEHFREKQLTRNAQLGTICEFLGVELNSAHRADHDAEAAGRVMFELPGRIVLPEALQDLLQIQRVLLRQVTEKFSRYRRGREAGRPALGLDEIIIELGAAYVYGDEADPVRALFSRIPDVRDISA